MEPGWRDAMGESGRVSRGRVRSYSRMVALYIEPVRDGEGVGSESILRDSEVLTVNLSTEFISVGDVDRCVASVAPARGVIGRGLGVACSTKDSLGVSCRAGSSVTGWSVMFSSSSNFLLWAASSTLLYLDGNRRANMWDDWELELSLDVEPELLSEEFLESGDAWIEAGGAGREPGESTAKKSTFRDLAFVTVNPYQRQSP